MFEFTAIGWMPVLAAVAALVTSVLFVTRSSTSKWAAAPSLLASAANLVLAFGSLAAVKSVGSVSYSVPWVTIGSFEIRAGTMLDGMAALMLLVVTVVSLLVQVFSTAYMQEDKGFARYFCYLSLFVAAMLGLVIADNLLMVYVCWELVGVCSYLLIGFWFQNRAPGNAAKKAFIVTRFGDMGLLIGLILLSNAAGTFDIATINQAAKDQALQSAFLKGALFTNLVPLLVFFGAAGKSAQFPLHVWLPDAMEGPTPVSALIHAATMVAAGVYLVARLFPVFAASAVALNVVAWVGAITALIGATTALVQWDVKKVLAYSTISQLGYMMVGLGMGSVTAGMFHLTTHAFFKALLFLAAGSVIFGMHHHQDMREMGGLHSKMKATSWTTILGALALAGVFPLSGFWSKDEILASAQKQPAIYAIGLLVAFLTAFYMTRLWFLTFGGQPKSEHAEHAHESPASMTVPLSLLAVLAVGAGIINLPGSHGLFNMLEPGAEAEHFSLITAVLGTLAAVIGIGWSASLYRKQPEVDPVTKLPGAIYRLFENKWYVDDFYEKGVAGASLTFGRSVAWFDKNVIDRAMDITASICAHLGNGFRLLTNGDPQWYIAVTTVAAIFAAILAATRAIGVGQ